MESGSDPDSAEIEELRYISMIQTNRLSDRDRNFLVYKLTQRNATVDIFPDSIVVSRHVYNLTERQLDSINHDLLNNINSEEFGIEGEKEDATVPAIILIAGLGLAVLGVSLLKAILMADWSLGGFGDWW